MEKILIELSRYIGEEHPVIAALVVLAILVIAVGIRRANRIPRHKIDRKVLRFVDKSLRENPQTTTSSVYAKFINEQVSVLNQSLRRLVNNGYLDATEVHLEWHTIHEVTEKGDKALWWIWW